MAILTVPFADAEGAEYSPTVTATPRVLTVGYADSEGAEYAPTALGGAFSLTAAGLLDDDYFDRADGPLGAEWAVEAGTFNIVSNTARGSTGAGVASRARFTALAARAAVAMQVTWKPIAGTIGNHYEHFWARRDSSGNGYDFRLTSGSFRIDRYANNVYQGTLAEVNPGALVLGTTYRVTIYAADGAQRSWLNAAAGPSASNASLAGGTGTVALQQNNENFASCTDAFDDMRVTPDTRVVFTNLPHGHKIRFSGGTTVVEGNGGVTHQAYVELGPYTWGASYLVEVLDAANVVVSSGAIPTMYGGATYQYTGPSGLQSGPRVAQAFAYTAEQSNNRRVAQAFAYTVHGPNERRVAQAFAYAVENNAPPSTPTILGPPAGAPVTSASIFTFTESTDAEGDPITYNARQRVNAGAWSAWFTGQPYGPQTFLVGPSRIGALDVELWANDPYGAGASASRSYVGVDPVLTGRATGAHSNRIYMTGGAAGLWSKLYVGTAPGFPRDADHLLDEWADVPPASYAHSSLDPETTYYYALVLGNAFGTAESNELALATLATATVEADIRLTGGLWNKRWDPGCSWINSTVCGLPVIKGGYTIGGSGPRFLCLNTQLASGQSVQTVGGFGELTGWLPFQPYAGTEWSTWGVGVLIRGGGDLLPDRDMAHTGIVMTVGSGPYGAFHHIKEWTPCYNVGKYQSTITITVSYPGGKVTRTWPGPELFSTHTPAMRPDCPCHPESDYISLSAYPDYDADPTGKTYVIQGYVHGDFYNWTVTLPARIPCGQPGICQETLGGWAEFQTFFYENIDEDTEWCESEPPPLPPCTPTIDPPSLQDLTECEVANLVGSPYAPNECAGAHLNTDWTVRRVADQVVVFEALADATNKTHRTFASGTLPLGVPLEAQITYRDDLDPATTATSAWHAFEVDAISVLGPPLIISPAYNEEITDTATLHFHASPGANANTRYGARFSYDAFNWFPLYELGTIDPDTDYPLDFSAYPPGVITLEVYAAGDCLQKAQARICVVLIPSPCPEAPPNITAIRRLELRSDYAGAGGACLYYIPEYGEPGGATDRREDQGVQAFTANILRAAGVFDHSGLLRGRRVLRRVYDDLTWDESRIVRISDGREETGEEVVEIACDGPLTDLQRSLLRRQLYVTGADGIQRPGQTLYQFPLYARTLTELADFILGAGAPPYFVRGTVEEWDGGETWDLDFDFDTAASALYKLCEKANRRLAYTRDCHGFLVHILKLPEEA